MVLRKYYIYYMQNYYTSFVLLYCALNVNSQVIDTHTL